MSKMNRERELKEKRALKQERKDQKKMAAAAAAAIEAGDDPVAPPPAEPIEKSVATLALESRPCGRNEH
jgi:hypothetical protein